MAIETVVEGPLAGYNGTQRAAMFLLALGDGAASVWQALNDDEVRNISQAMSTLGAVTADTTQAVFTAFIAGMSGASSLRGSAEMAERVLSSFLPADKVSEILAEVRGPAGRTTWEKLGNVKADVLANYLKHETPQTVAAILMRLNSTYAADLLSALPEDFAYDCAARMISIGSVGRTVSDEMESVLRTEFLAGVGGTTRRDNHEMMAEIFNHFDRATETALSRSLELAAPDSMARIHALMFVFEDLAAMDGTAAQILLRGVERSDLAIALKGASDTIRNLFIGNMSERAAKIFREEMSAMGAVRLKDVEAAQTRIVVAAKALAEAGEITLSAKGNTDDWVY
jgi:flagellar motor switch protein FliG